MTREPIIQAHGLVKTFRTRRGTVEAVRGVDLEVSRGEIVGFLGPNGAGKTTTLRMLTTLLDPTEGSATVAGHDLAGNPTGVRRSIGYVSQAGGSAPEAIVREEIIFHARSYGISKTEAAARADELLPRMDLDGLAKRVVKTLSGGQRRRMDIAMGLVHQPELVFLDEPTTGLDPQSRANMWEHIQRIRAELETTIFLTTHYLDEADALCDRIFVIDAGRIVASGTSDELKSRVAGDLVRISLAGTSADVQAVRKVIADQPGATTPELEVDRSGATTVGFRVPNGHKVLVTLLRALDGAGIEPSDVQVHRPTLDDVFLTMTGRALRDEETE